MLRCLRLRCDSATSLTSTILLFQNYPFFLSSLRSISSCVIENGNFYVLSYLIENCGLSQTLAISASKKISFKNPHRPDSVLAFFRKHGFSNTQITTVIRKRPEMLLADPEKTLLPKVNFFYSKGFSSPDIAKVLSLLPKILHSSMENQIIPAFHVIRKLVHSDENATFAIKRYPGIILLSDLDNYVLPNIKILQENGVPGSSIVWLVRYQPETLITSSYRFTEMLEEAKRMGLNPLAKNFVVAIKAFRSMSKTNWQKKIDIFKRWGWSEEEIIVAFGKNPWCFMCSEKKITALMDFYVNKMGWDSSSIACCPVLITLSLEKRVLPRCSVLKVLLSKSLIRLGYIASPLSIPEELLLHKFVIPYEKEVPNLLKFYQEKLNLAKCGENGERESKQL